MNISNLFLLLPLPFVLISCVPLDPLQRAADAADRAGSQSATRHDGSNAMDSAFKVAETLYYSKKYQGNPVQIQQALERGRRLASEWRNMPQARTQGVSRGSPPRSSSSPPRYMTFSLGKSADSGNTQMAIFDTQSIQIVGNNIYELKNPPKGNVLVKFDTYTVQYVGSGAPVQ